MHCALKLLQKSHFTGHLPDGHTCACIGEGQGWKYDGSGNFSHEDQRMYHPQEVFVSFFIIIMYLLNHKFIISTSLSNTNRQMLKTSLIYFLLQCVGGYRKGFMTRTTAISLGDPLTRQHWIQWICLTRWHSQKSKKLPPLLWMSSGQQQGLTAPVMALQ